MADSWDDFTANPILTIKSGTCPKAVADSTDRLCQCAQDQLEHLEARARTLATCGHFEEALKDAYTMTRVVRSSPLGYLCVGHVYALQGRQKAAIGIYEQGLDAVPSTDPSRQRLVEARSMAQERDSTRIDFIKELPIDIIENIAPWILCPQEQIPPSEIREYLDVSRVWRERLLMSIRELHIESTPDDDLADDDDLLEQIAPICTALTLQDTTDGFPRLMPKTLFPSLKALNDAEEPLSNETTPEICTNALASVGSTLRYLTINAWEYGICLGDILSSCPNLVYLEARKMDADLANGPECHPNLKILLSWDWNIEAVDIDDITKRLPGLEVFAANPIEYTKDLKTIQDNCPYVKVLGINDHETSYFYLPSTITRTTSKHDDDRVGGVHTLYIDRFDTTTFYSNIREVMDFMRRNNHTLQHVYFYYPLGGRGGKNASILNHAIQAADGGGGAPYFKSMTTFTNCICDYDDILLTRWIVRESPHLKELELMRYAAYSAGPADTSALFDDLIGRCELESVVFDLKADPAMDMGGVERFIQYHGTFDSPLHTLTLPKHTRLSKDALEVLTRLPQLEKLNISWPLMKEEDQEDENCSHLIGKLKRLQHLEIWSDEVIPDDVFLQLSKLNVTSLKLHMPIFKSSKQLALLSLLQCPKLEELDVSDSSHEDDVSVSSYEDDPQIDEIRNMLGSKIETMMVGDGVGRKAAMMPNALEMLVELTAAISHAWIIVRQVVSLTIPASSSFTNTMADVWSDVTEQPIPVIKSGTCPNVIADSTRRLQQCLQEQLTHLDTRAKALATCGNFEAALKDATRIRQLVPSSAAGYLCAGHVYSLQGRQEAAIDIYDEGLAAVPSSDPSHQRLVEARSMAQQRDSTRIDFINKLPLDITMNIVPRIMLCDGSVPPSEIRDYLEVSRVWREKLLACVGELHVLSTIDDSHLDDKELLGLIAPYCTTLTLESKVTCLRQFISDTQFPLLRSLHIVQAWDSAGGDYDEEDEYGSGYLRDIIASFRSTATLTHLRIFADESCYIPFADILSNCPSLVDLEATCIDSDMSTAPTSCPNMKSVSFMLNEEQEFDMDDITKRFPELEKLVISPFYYAGALSTIQRNCPKLKIIGSHGDGGFLATTNDDDTPTTTMDGVRMLYLHDYVTHWLDPYEGEMDYVMEFMQQNSHTLQDVSFYTSFPYSDEPPIVANSHAVTFPQMTSYKQQKIYVPQHLRIAKMVVQKSPHLKHFELVRGGFDDDDKIYVNVGELFDDLIGLSTLKSAIIKLASNDPMLDKESVERFIQYHSTIDSQLHTLILPQNMRLSNDALDTLTALPQLKTLGLDLSLVQDEDAKDDEKVSSFIQKLGSGCPQLQHLELLSEGPIPDVVFVQLSKLNITSLQLTMLSPIMGKKKAATSLLHLLECPQLQELYISPPCNTKNQTNAFIRRMLESQIPKLCW